MGGSVCRKRILHWILRYERRQQKKKSNKQSKKMLEGDDLSRIEGYRGGQVKDWTVVVAKAVRAFGGKCTKKVT